MIFPLDNLGAVNVHASSDSWRGADIAEAVDSRARELVSAGLGPGDRAVLCQIGSGNFFADLFAVWSAGAAAAVLNPGLTADEVHNVVGHVDPKLALVGNGMKSSKEDFAVPVVDFGAGIGPTALSRIARSIGLARRSRLDSIHIRHDGPTKGSGAHI